MAIVADGSAPASRETPSLSLVIPAYNEETRILRTIEAANEYLAERCYDFEIVVADDGSTDETASIVQAYAAHHPMVQLLSLPHRGKAAAVRAGIGAARMDQIVFCDADLAVPLTHLAEFRAALGNGSKVVIGSRQGIGARRIGEPAYRHLMGRVFNWFVRFLVLPGIQDTQCGFKMFARDAAEEIWARARLYRDSTNPIAGPRVTAFDVETLVIARRLGFRIYTIPVVWTYGEQSKVNPGRDTWFNVTDVLMVRLNAWRGRYD